jgi:hypothetical protein
MGTSTNARQRPFLFDLLVQCVLAVESTELLQLKALGAFPLIPRSGVVLAFTLSALKYDILSH